MATNKVQKRKKKEEEEKRETGILFYPESATDLKLCTMEC